MRDLNRSEDPVQVTSLLKLLFLLFVAKHYLARLEDPDADVKMCYIKFSSRMTQPNLEDLTTGLDMCKLG
jgi:hypothetical protein